MRSRWWGPTKRPAHAHTTAPSLRLKSMPLRASNASKLTMIAVQRVVQKSRGELGNWWRQQGVQR